MPPSVGPSCQGVSGAGTPARSASTGRSTRAAPLLRAARPGPERLAGTMSWALCRAEPEAHFHSPTGSGRSPTATPVPAHGGQAAGQVLATENHPGLAAPAPLDPWPSGAPGGKVSKDTAQGRGWPGAALGGADTGRAWGRGRPTGQASQSCSRQLQGLFLGEQTLGAWLCPCHVREAALSPEPRGRSSPGGRGGSRRPAGRRRQQRPGAR